MNAVSRGDLTQTMSMENDKGPLKNEFLRGAEVTNNMVDQLNKFSGEVLRVTKEVVQTANWAAKRKWKAFWEYGKTYGITSISWQQISPLK
jgi:hypothetical protein